MFEDYSLLLSVTLASAAFLVVQYVSHQRHRASMPPGPVGYPIIGNVFDMPSGYDPLVWAKFKDTYGPITSLSALGTCLVMINDVKVAEDLFEKMSSNYSDRPSPTFSGEMIGWSRSAAFYQYRDNRFRLSRKFMSQTVGSKKVVRSFHDMLEFEARHFLARVHEQPDNLIHHIRAWAGASILRITYGYNVSRNGVDPLIQSVESAEHDFTIASQPGAWLVDIVPFLRYLPSWLPGMEFKTLARKYRKSLDVTAETPFAFTKAQIASGVAPESYISKLFNSSSTTSQDEELIKWSAFTLYVGGADTVVSTLYSFYLAMILYPDVQKTAQKEIDALIGTDRFPTLADREQLPYVNAVLKEILRWVTALPFGVPHVASEDSTYNGYFIPKGAVLMPNLWLFNHDPSNFDDPDCFKPERFLGDQQPKVDPYDTAFGIGRRFCAGREFADSTMFATVVMTLAAFSIKRAVGDEERSASDYLKWKEGFIRHPVHFRCEIRPRTERAKVLLESTQDEFPLPPNNADALKALLTYT